MALETLSTKTQEIGRCARRCISQFIELGGWEVNMELFRSFICKALILLATTVLMSTVPFALAQEQTESRRVTRAEITENEQRFLIESDQQNEPWA